MNDEKYLINTEYAYNKIKMYFPEKFIAKSKFKRIDSLNTIEQEYLSGKSDFIISYKEKDKKLLENVDEFLDYALNMLEKEKWLPDFDIKRLLKGHNFRLLFDNKKNPKITDSTHYYDVFRLFPERTNKIVRSKREQIIRLKEFVSAKIK